MRGYFCASATTSDVKTSNEDHKTILSTFKPYFSRWATVVEACLHERGLDDLSDVEAPAHDGRAGPLQEIEEI